MKKISKVIITLVILIAIAFLSFRYAPLYIVDLFGSKAGIQNGLSYYEYLTDEETEIIKNIVCNRWYFYDGGEYMCGFSDEFSIKVGNNVFMPAQDGCMMIKVNNRAINITGEERNNIDAIFSKYINRE